MDRPDPAVAATLDGLNKNGIVGGVAQSVAQAHDRAADALLEIHEDIRGPKRLAKLFPRNHDARVGQQKSQSTKRQVLNADLRAVPAEFAGAQVGFEFTTPIEAGNWHFRAYFGRFS